MAFPRVNLIYLEHALYFFLSWRLIPGTRKSLVQLTAKCWTSTCYRITMPCGTSQVIGSMQSECCIGFVEMMILLLIVFFDSQGWRYQSIASKLWNVLYCDRREERWFSLTCIQAKWHNRDLETLFCLRQLPKRPSPKFHWQLLSLAHCIALLLFHLQQTPHHIIDISVKMPEIFEYDIEHSFCWRSIPVV